MKLGLAFSGGKDSLACLLLNKDKADEITVFWVNTGKTYPETLQIVEYAKSLFTNFIEIKSDREDQNAREGLPSDVVPINFTRIGQMVTGKKETLVQSYLMCCYENIGYRIHQAALSHGITHLIRGQRLEESHKSTARDGDVVDGLVYLQPIESWTKQEVLNFINNHMELPKHFAISHSSLDCYDCTAYVKESKDRINYTKEHHPIFYAEYRERMDSLNKVLSSEICYA